jgi:FtsZ-binding cell division protein ZapB
MEMQQMMERLLAKMDANQAEMKGDQEERKAEMKTNDKMLVRMEAKIEADNEKFEVLQDTLVSQIDAHQERIMACLGKMEAQLWGKFSLVRVRSVASGGP